MVIGGYHAVANSYIDNPHEHMPDAMRCFANLAKSVIRNPLATFIFRSKTKENKIRFLIVDRSVRPDFGSRIIIATEHGLKEAFMDDATPACRIWGTVVWFLEQG